MKSFLKTFALLAVTASASSSFAANNPDMGDVGSLAEKTAITFSSIDLATDLAGTQAAVITQTGSNGWAAIEQDSTNMNIAYILQASGGSNPTYAFINQTSTASGNVAIINQK
jgi:hypothetical protein